MKFPELVILRYQVGSFKINRQRHQNVQRFSVFMKDFIPQESARPFDLKFCNRLNLLYQIQIVESKVFSWQIITAFLKSKAGADLCFFLSGDETEIVISIHATFVITELKRCSTLENCHPCGFFDNKRHQNYFCPYFDQQSKLFV